MLAKTIAHYEVLDQLGEGGMGVVYRGRDTRLDREVAIKALPEEFAGDPERLARFEREAKVLASLNHPHIASIHGMEKAAEQSFLILELVEGETLAERIARGPVPVHEALEFGCQIAEALEAAHEHGIIHRDLKPANIKVTPEGQVKVLDFGLAKALRIDVPDGDMDLSPTLTQPMTRAGQIVGTPVYMSPEQAEGQEAGKQSDIWTFGCVLYEMLAGKRAFQGPTASEAEPTPQWQALPETTPLLVRSMLRRCLERDLRRRLHDIADARIELEEALRELALAPEGLLPATAVHSAFRKGVIWTLASIAVAAALGMTGWLLTRPEPSAPSIRRFDLDPPSGVVVSRSSGSATLAVSPDGKWVAFRGYPEDSSAPAQLYLRSIEELQARPVPGTEDGVNPFFSPDSRWLGFYSRGAIRRVPLTGSEPLLICQADRLRGASWAEDGSVLFSVGEGLQRVSAEGGEPAVVTTPEVGDWKLNHRWPHHLPGGRAALFLVHRGVGEANHEIAVLSLETGEQRTLLRGGTYPRYADGNLVFSRLGTLYAAPFDLEQLELTGEPRPVLDDVNFYPGSYSVAYDLSRTGALVFNPGAERLRDAELVQVDRQGKVSPLVGRRAAYAYGSAPVLSPDGRRLVVTVASGLEEVDLWVYESARDVWERLTLDGGYKDQPPVWTPDGESILLSTAHHGAMKIFRLAADGTGTPEQLTTGLDWDYPNSVSADGRELLFMRAVAPAQWDILILPLEGEDRTPRPFLATPALEAWPVFSPDGSWVAYESHESGRREIYVRPYPGPGPKVRISTQGGLTPQWNPNGRELFYRSGQAIWAVPVETGPELAAGRPEPVVEIGFLTTSAWLNPFQVSPDGQRFRLVKFPEEAQEPLRLVYVPNWTAELERAVSGGGS